MLIGEQLTLQVDYFWVQLKDLKKLGEYLQNILKSDLAKFFKFQLQIL